MNDNVFTLYFLILAHDVFGGEKNPLQMASEF